MSITGRLLSALGLKRDEGALRLALGQKLDAIEAELRGIGSWSETPPTPEQMQFTRAFAGDTMSYAQWLQFVFLPNARAMVAGTYALPARSMVGAQAVREFDGMDEAGRLCVLLATFDAMVETRKVSG